VRRTARHNTPENMERYVAEHFAPALQAAELADPGLMTLVAEVAGQAAGYTQLGHGAAPACVTGADPLEVIRFYVDRPWHGQGLAQALMRAAADHARAAGARTLWLGVWERNPRAIAFYKKVGFVEVGTHTFVLAPITSATWCSRARSTDEAVMASAQMDCSCGTCSRRPGEELARRPEPRGSAPRRHGGAGRLAADAEAQEHLGARPPYRVLEVHGSPAPRAWGAAGLPSAPANFPAQPEPADEAAWSATSRCSAPSTSSWSRRSARSPGAGWVRSRPKAAGGPMASWCSHRGPRRVPYRTDPVAEAPLQERALLGRGGRRG